MVQEARCGAKPASIPGARPRDSLIGLPPSTGETAGGERTAAQP